MELTKLDAYDYTIVAPGVIRIFLNGTNDPTLVDIMSEIEQSNGRIYVEGNYYLYSGNYMVDSCHDGAILDLKVTNAV